MEKHMSEGKRFSIVSRAKSFAHAIRGIGIVVCTQHNAWVHVSSAVVAVALGIYLKISSLEWIFIVLAVGMVFAAEAFNTAIEIDIDLTSPEYHPYARDTKDVAAGAVLVTVVMAIIIGIVIFLPKILMLR